MTCEFCKKSFLIQILGRIGNSWRSEAVGSHWRLGYWRYRRNEGRRQSSCGHSNHLCFWIQGKNEMKTFNIFFYLFTQSSMLFSRSITHLSQENQNLNHDLLTALVTIHLRPGTSLSFPRTPWKELPRESSFTLEIILWVYFLAE